MVFSICASALSMSMTAAGFMHTNIWLMPFSPSAGVPISSDVRPRDSMETIRSIMMDSALPFHRAIGVIRPLLTIFLGSQVRLPSVS